MRIAIVTLGTLGDVVPYIALGQGFKAAGDEVTLVTFQRFEALIRQHKLEFYAINKSLEDFMQRDWTQFRITPRTIAQALSHLPQNAQIARQLLELLMKDCLDAFEGIDLVIGQVVGHLAAWPVAQQLNIPYYAAFCSPLHRTRAFPNAFATSIVPAGPGWRPWGGKEIYNWWTHTFSSRIFWSRMYPILLKALQSTLKRPVSSLDFHVPVLYGHSPSVLPKPQEWGPHITVTGYWLLNEPEDWQPPVDLVAFLDAGSPPVYLGFGSMVGLEAQKMIHVILQVLQKLHMRCVLLADRSEWPELSSYDTIFVIKSAPHSWLFPRMSVIMHHGGPGTAAAAMRAGIPQIIVPFLSDQSFWGHLMVALGVGPAPLHRKKIQPLRVQDAFEQILTNAEMRQRARALGELIRNEDGVARAIETVHGMYAKQLDYKKRQFQAHSTQ